MKKFISLFISALCILFAVSCEKEWNGKTLGEGLPVRSLSFKIAIPSEEVDVKTRATDPYNVINDIYIILIPENPDSVAKVFGPLDMGTPTVSGTSQTYTVNIDLSKKTVIGGKYYLYAMANFGDIDIDAFDELGMTREKLLAFPLEFPIDYFDPTENTEDGVFMTGAYCSGTSSNGLVTLLGADPDTGMGGSNQLKGSIRLRRTTARIHFDFNSADGVNFTPEHYTIYRYPIFSTLFERSGWDGSDPNGINPDGNSGNLEIIGEDTAYTGPFYWDDYGYDISAGTIDFMMPENVQYAVHNPTRYYDREAHVSSTDTSFLNAPANATYVVVSGKYKDSKYEGQVSYTIHLGDFSTGNFSNFSVRRNYKYNYHITINGVSSIVAECNSASFYEPQPGAEGKLSTGTIEKIIEMDVDGGTETVLLDKALLDSCKLTVRTSIHEHAHTDETPSATKELDGYCTWVRFSKSSADSAESGSIYDLIEDVKNETWKYCTLTDDGEISFVVTCQKSEQEEGMSSTDVQSLTLDYDMNRVSLDGKSSVDGTLIFTVKQTIHSWSYAS